MCTIHWASLHRLFRFISSPFISLSKSSSTITTAASGLHVGDLFRRCSGQMPSATMSSHWVWAPKTISRLCHRKSSVKSVINSYSPFTCLSWLKLCFVFWRPAVALYLRVQLALHSTVIQSSYVTHIFFSFLLLFFFKCWTIPLTKQFFITGS